MEGRPLTDSELAERASHGELDAYEELVRRNSDLVFRTAYLVLGDADEASDAAQETFLRAYDALPRFRAGAEPRPWLLRIAANAARNRRRGAGRRMNLTLRLAQDRSSGGAAPSPEAAVLADERRRELLAALDRLRDEDRLVIGYRWFLELSEVEMAAALGVRRGTVKSRLSRAMARLRAAMDPGVMGDG